MARKAKISRKTKETSITVSVNLDGKGKYKIKTGIGFLDHMLEQLSKHSLIDLEVNAKGDTHIDLHHTTEDTGIAIGEAIKKAAGNRKGIKRYASTMIPMDETLSRVSIDVSNRPYLIWKVNLPVEKLGEMDTELFKEWFQAFSQSAGVTLPTRISPLSTKAPILIIPISSRLLKLSSDTLGISLVISSGPNLVCLASISYFSIWTDV